MRSHIHKRICRHCSAEVEGADCPDCSAKGLRPLIVVCEHLPDLEDANAQPWIVTVKPEEESTNGRS